MKPFKTKKYGRTLSLRLVAFCLLIVYVLTNHFGREAFAATPRVETKIPAAILNLNELSLPKEIGRIEETFLGKNPRTILLLKDAHSIPEAQKNIRKILEYLQEKYGITEVALEGAQGDLDAQILRSFPDSKKLEKVLEEKANHGEIPGSVQAAILRKNSAHYYGVEDWEAYLQGIELYRRAQSKNSETLAALETQKKALQEKKKGIFSPELLRIDEAYARFDKKQTSFLDLFKLLKKTKTPESGSKLALLAVMAENEENASPDAAKEIRNAAAQLKALAKTEQLKELNAKQQLYETHQISDEVFADFLKQTGKSLGIELVFTKPLEEGVQNSQRLSEMNGGEFFKEFEIYYQQVIESLIRNQAQRELIQESKAIQTQEHLLRLELSRSEWEGYKVTTSQGHAEISESFYQNAEVREKAFLKNLQNHPHTILIAGGFHADGLAEAFKKQGISYALMSPAIASLPDQNFYQAQMKGEVSWKKYFESQEGEKRNLYDGFVRGMRDELLDVQRPEYSVERLKLWRDQIIRDLAGTGKVGKASDYTHYLDELISVQKTPDWVLKAKNFVEGLRQLEANHQFTENNILKLLRLGTIPAWSSTAAILSPSAFVPNFLKRSEMPSVRAEPRTSPVSASSPRSEMREEETLKAAGESLKAANEKMRIMLEQLNPQWRSLTQKAYDAMEWSEERWAQEFKANSNEDQIQVFLLGLVQEYMWVTRVRTDLLEIQGKTLEADFLSRMILNLEYIVASPVYTAQRIPVFRNYKGLIREDRAQIGSDLKNALNNLRSVQRSESRQSGQQSFSDSNLKLTYWELRQKLGRNPTQKELGDKFGVSHTAIYKRLKRIKQDEELTLETRGKGQASPVDQKRVSERKGPVRVRSEMPSARADLRTFPDSPSSARSEMRSKILNQIKNQIERWSTQAVPVAVLVAYEISVFAALWDRGFGFSETQGEMQGAVGTGVSAVLILGVPAIGVALWNAIHNSSQQKKLSARRSELRATIWPIKKVFVVDDVESNRKLMVNAVRRALPDAEIYIFDDGAPALEKFDASVGLLVTDIEMKKLGGDRLITAIRPTSDIPVIIYTSSSIRPAHWPNVVKVVKGSPNEIEGWIRTIERSEARAGNAKKKEKERRTEEDEVKKTVEREPSWFVAPRDLEKHFETEKLLTGVREKISEAYHAYFDQLVSIARTMAAYIENKWKTPLTPDQKRFFTDLSIEQDSEYATRRSVVMKILANILLSGKSDGGYIPIAVVYHPLITDFFMDLEELLRHYGADDYQTRKKLKRKLSVLLKETLGKYEKEREKTIHEQGKNVQELKKLTERNGANGEHAQNDKKNHNRSESRLSAQFSISYLLGITALLAYEVWAAVTLAQFGIWQAAIAVAPDNEAGIRINADLAIGVLMGGGTLAGIYTMKHLFPTRGISRSEARTIDEFLKGLTNEEVATLLEKVQKEFGTLKAFFQFKATADAPHREGRFTWDDARVLLARAQEIQSLVKNQEPDRADLQRLFFKRYLDQKSVYRDLMTDQESLKKFDLTLLSALWELWYDNPDAEMRLIEKWTKFLTSGVALFDANFSKYKIMGLHSVDKVESHGNFLNLIQLEEALLYLWESHAKPHLNAIGWTEDINELIANKRNPADVSLKWRPFPEKYAPQAVQGFLDYFSKTIPPHWNVVSYDLYLVEYDGDDKEKHPAAGWMAVVVPIKDTKQRRTRDAVSPHSPKVPAGRSEIRNEEKEPLSITQDIQKNGALIYQWNAREERKKFKDIPDRALLGLQLQGFNVLWMTGIWKISEFSEPFNKMWDSKRVGSAYSIDDYVINPELGDEASFREFVARANAHGIKVIVDFIPNHMGVNSPWIQEDPHYFISPSDLDAEKVPFMNPGDKTLAEPLYDYLARGKEGFIQRDFFKTTDREGKSIIIAHGRNMESTWLDTAQLNLTYAPLREKLRKTMEYLVWLTRGGGMRIDAVDRTTRKAFRETWKIRMQQEFWPSALRLIKEKYPTALMIPETFWGGEKEFQNFGADFPYDMEFYRRVVENKDSKAPLADFLTSQSFDLSHSLHFLENHDSPNEKRVAGLMSRDQQMAAAVLMSAAAPGGLLIHAGQMEGRSQEKPSAIYLTSDKEKETHDSELEVFYKKLLKRTKRPLFRYGEVEKVPGFSSASPNVVAVKRKLKDQSALVIVNYSKEPASFQYNPTAQDWQIEPSEKDRWRNLMTDENLLFSSPIPGELKSWETRILLLNPLRPRGVKKALPEDSDARFMLEEFERLQKEHEEGQLKLEALENPSVEIDFIGTKLEPGLNLNFGPAMRGKIGLAGKKYYDNSFYIKTLSDLEFKHYLVIGHRRGSDHVLFMFPQSGIYDIVPMPANNHFAPDFLRDQRMVRAFEVNILKKFYGNPENRLRYIRSRMEQSDGVWQPRLSHTYITYPFQKFQLTLPDPSKKTWEHANFLRAGFKASGSLTAPVVLMIGRTEASIPQLKESPAFSYFLFAPIGRQVYLYDEKGLVRIFPYETDTRFRDVPELLKAFENTKNTKPIARSEAREDSNQQNPNIEAIVTQIERYSAELKKTIQKLPDAGGVDFERQRDVSVLFERFQHQVVQLAPLAVENPDYQVKQNALKNYIKQQVRFLFKIREVLQRKGYHLDLKDSVNDYVEHAERWYLGTVTYLLYLRQIKESQRILAIEEKDQIAASEYRWFAIDVLAQEGNMEAMAAQLYLPLQENLNLNDIFRIYPKLKSNVSRVMRDPDYFDSFKKSAGDDELRQIELKTNLRDLYSRGENVLKQIEKLSQQVMSESQAFVPPQGTSSRSELRETPLAQAIQKLNPQTLEGYRILHAIAEDARPGVLESLEHLDAMPMLVFSEDFERKLDDFANQVIAKAPAYKEIRKEEEELSQAVVLLFYLAELNNAQEIKELLLEILRQSKTMKAKDSWRYREHILNAMRGLVFDDENPSLSLGAGHKRMILDLSEAIQNTFRNRFTKKIREQVLEKLRLLVRLGYYEEAVTLVNENHHPELQEELDALWEKIRPSLALESVRSEMREGSQNIDRRTFGAQLLAFAAMTGGDFSLAQETAFNNGRGFVPFINKMKREYPTNAFMPEQEVNKAEDQQELVASGVPMEFAEGFLYNGGDFDKFLLEGSVHADSYFTRVPQVWALQPFFEHSYLFNAAVFMIDAQDFNRFQENGHAHLRLSEVNKPESADKIVYTDPYPKITVPFSHDLVKQVWINYSTFKGYERLAEKLEKTPKEVTFEDRLRLKNFLQLQKEQKIVVLDIGNWAANDEQRFLNSFKAVNDYMEKTGLDKQMPRFRARASVDSIPLEKIRLQAPIPAKLHTEEKIFWGIVGAGITAGLFGVSSLVAQALHSREKEKSGKDKPEDQASRSEMREGSQTSVPITYMGKGENSRAIDMFFDRDILKAIRALDRETSANVMGRLKRILSQYPKDWKSGDFDAEVGGTPLKRTVKINLPKPIEIYGEIIDAIEITGVLFTQENLGEDFLGMMIPGTNQTWAEVPREQWEGSTTITIGKDGRPVFEKMEFSQLGGHGAGSAKRKFLRTKDLLPSRGLRGPLAMAYGEYRVQQRYGKPIQKDGKPLGVFISLSRKNAPPRYADILENKVSSFWNEFLINRTRASAGKNILDTVRATEKNYKFAELYRKYGQELRILFDKELYPPQPHWGNVTIDPKGVQPTTWHDLGGWRVGNNPEVSEQEQLTEAQKFGYAYYMLYKALVAIQGHLIGDVQKGLYQDRIVDPYTEFFKTFFHDQLDNPYFRQALVQFREENIATMAENGLYDSRYETSPEKMAPLYKRMELPFVPVLRQLFGMSVPQFTDTIKEDPRKPLLRAENFEGRNILALSGMHSDSELSRLFQEEVIPQVTNPQEWVFFIESGNNPRVAEREVIEIQNFARDKNIPIENPIVEVLNPPVAERVARKMKVPAEAPYALWVMAQAGSRAQRPGGGDILQNIKNAIYSFKIMWPQIDEIAIDHSVKGLAVMEMQQKGSSLLYTEMLGKAAREIANDLSRQALPYLAEKYPNKKIFFYSGGEHRVILNMKENEIAPENRISEEEVANLLSEQTAAVNRLSPLTSDLPINRSEARIQQTAALIERSFKEDASELEELKRQGYVIGIDNIRRMLRESYLSGIPSPYAGVSGYAHSWTESDLLRLEVLNELKLNELHAGNHAKSIYAAKFIDDGGQKGVELFVADDGTGIDSIQQSVETYFSSTGKETRGRGLPAVKNMVLSGGRGYLDVSNAREALHYESTSEAPTRLEPLVSQGTLIHVVRFVPPPASFSSSRSEIRSQVQPLLEQIKVAQDMDEVYRLASELGQIESIDFTDSLRQIEKFPGHLKTDEQKQVLEHAKKFLELYHASFRANGAPEGQIIQPAKADAELQKEFLKRFPQERVEKGIEYVRSLFKNEGESPVVSLADLPTIREFQEKTGIPFDVFGILEYLSKQPGKSSPEPTVTGSFKRRQFVEKLIQSGFLYIQGEQTPGKPPTFFINSSGNAIQGLLHEVQIFVEDGIEMDGKIWKLPKGSKVVMVAHDTLSEAKEKMVKNKFPEFAGGVLFTKDFIRDARSLGMYENEKDKNVRHKLENINELLTELDKFVDLWNKQHPNEPRMHVRASNEESALLGGASILRNAREQLAALGIDHLDYIGMGRGGGGPTAGMPLEALYHEQKTGRRTVTWSVGSEIPTVSVADGQAIQNAQSLFQESFQALPEYLKSSNVPEKWFYKALWDLHRLSSVNGLTVKAEASSAAALAKLYSIMADPAQWHLLRPDAAARKKVVALVLSGMNYSDYVPHLAQEVYEKEKMEGADYLFANAVYQAVKMDPDYTKLLENLKADTNTENDKEMEQMVSNKIAQLNQSLQQPIPEKNLNDLIYSWILDDARFVKRAQSLRSEARNVANLAQEPQVILKFSQETRKANERESPLKRFDLNRIPVKPGMLWVSVQKSGTVPMQQFLGISDATEYRLLLDELESELLGNNDAKKYLLDKVQYLEAWRGKNYQVVIARSSKKELLAMIIRDQEGGTTPLLLDYEQFEIMESKNGLEFRAPKVGWGERHKTFLEVWKAWDLWAAVSNGMYVLEPFRLKAKYKSLTFRSQKAAEHVMEEMRDAAESQSDLKSHFTPQHFRELLQQYAGFFKDAGNATYFILTRGHYLAFNDHRFSPDKIAPYYLRAAREYKTMAEQNDLARSEARVKEELEDLEKQVHYIRAEALSLKKLLFPAAVGDLVPGAFFKGYEDRLLYYGILNQLNWILSTTDYYDLLFQIEELQKSLRKIQAPTEKTAQNDPNFKALEESKRRLFYRRTEFTAWGEQFFKNHPEFYGLHLPEGAPGKSYALITESGPWKMAKTLFYRERLAARELKKNPGLRYRLLRYLTEKIKENAMPEMSAENFSEGVVWNALSEWFLENFNLELPSVYHSEEIQQLIRFPSFEEGDVDDRPREAWNIGFASLYSGMNLPFAASRWNKDHLTWEVTHYNMRSLMPSEINFDARHLDDFTEDVIRFLEILPALKRSEARSGKYEIDLPLLVLAMYKTPAIRKKHYQITAPFLREEGLKWPEPALRKGVREGYFERTGTILDKGGKGEVVVYEFTSKANKTAQKLQKAKKYAVLALSDFNHKQSPVTMEEFVQWIADHPMLNPQALTTPGLENAGFKYRAYYYLQKAVATGWMSRHRDFSADGHSLFVYQFTQKAETFLKRSEMRDSDLPLPEALEELLPGMSFGERVIAIHGYRLNERLAEISNYARQKMLAQDSGIPISTVGHIEKMNGKLPNPGHILRLSNTLKVDPSYLIWGKSFEKTWEQFSGHGEKLQFLRLHQGLTQVELASALIAAGLQVKIQDPKMIRSTIAQWEKGVTPDNGSQEIVSNYFGFMKEAIFEARPKKNIKEKVVKEKMIRQKKAPEPIADPAVEKEKYQEKLLAYVQSLHLSTNQAGLIERMTQTNFPQPMVNSFTLGFQAANALISSASEIADQQIQNLDQMASTRPAGASAQRIYDTGMEMLNMRRAEMRDNVLSEYQKFRTEVDVLMAKYSGGYDHTQVDEPSGNEVRLLFKKAAEGLDGFSHTFKLLKNAKLARKLHREAQAIYRAMQHYEDGLFPVVLQREKALSALRQGDVDAFLNHFEGYLTGKGVPVYRRLDEVGKKRQIEYMKIEARETLVSLEEPVRKVFAELKVIAGSQDKLQKIVKAERRFEAMVKEAKENPNGYPKRPVASKKNRGWNEAKYLPEYFVTQKVLDNDYTKNPQGFADPEDIHLIKKKIEGYGKKIQLNEKGYPLNPSGPKYLRGRGALGHWGPNLAVDLIITRINPTTKLLEMLVVRRQDTGQWAIPGGLRAVILGESSITLEEISKAMQDHLKSKASMELQLDQIDKATEIYRGYIEDPRETDNAWVETIARHIHLKESDPAFAAPVKSNVKFVKEVRWLPLNEKTLQGFYAAHGELVKKAIGKTSSSKTMRSEARVEEAEAAALVKLKDEAKNLGFNDTELGIMRNAKEVAYMVGSKLKEKLERESLDQAKADAMRVGITQQELKLVGNPLDTAKLTRAKVVRRLLLQNEELQKEALFKTQMENALKEAHWVTKSYNFSKEADSPDVRARAMRERFIQWVTDSRTLTWNAGLHGANPDGSIAASMEIVKKWDEVQIRFSQAGKRLFWRHNVAWSWTPDHVILVIVETQNGKDFAKLNKNKRRALGAGKAAFLKNVAAWAQENNVLLFAAGPELSQILNRPLKNFPTVVKENYDIIFDRNDWQLVKDIPLIAPGLQMRPTKTYEYWVSKGNAAILGKSKAESRSESRTLSSRSETGSQMVSKYLLQDKFGDRFDESILSGGKDEMFLYKGSQKVADRLPGAKYVFRALNSEGPDPRRVIKITFYAADNANLLAEALKLYKLEKAGVRGVPKISRIGMMQKGGMWLELDGIANAWSLDREIFGRPGRLFSTLLNAAEILQNAHNAGVIHQDIKPSNILINDDQEVQINDWGNAMTPEFSPYDTEGKLLKLGPDTDVYTFILMLAGFLEHQIDAAIEPSPYRLMRDRYLKLIFRDWTFKNVMEVLTFNGREKFNPLPRSEWPQTMEPVIEHLISDLDFISSRILADRSELRQAAGNFVKAIRKERVSDEELRKAAQVSVKAGAKELIQAMEELIYEMEVTEAFGGTLPVNSKVATGMLENMKKALAPMAQSNGGYTVGYEIPKNADDSALEDFVDAVSSLGLVKEVKIQQGGDRKLQQRLVEKLRKKGIRAAIEKLDRKNLIFAGEQQYGGMLVSENSEMTPGSGKFIPIILTQGSKTQDRFFGKLSLTIQTGVALLLAYEIQDETAHAKFLARPELLLEKYGFLAGFQGMIKGQGGRLEISSLAIEKYFEAVARQSFQASA